MNKDVFIGYLKDPATMDATSMPGLKNLISQYPYFQTAHLLYLKNLYNEKSIDYSSQLKIAAVYANSRKRLYELVMQDELRSKIESIAEPAKTAVAAIDISPLEEQILKEAVSASIELEIESDIEALEDKKEISQPKSSTKSKKEPDTKGKFTFNQWLDKIEQGGASTSSVSTSDELIGKFIVDSPGLSKRDKEARREDFFSPIDTARLSIIDDEEFVTETLAKIYENQEFYDKAIKAYELLSLKYPKNSNTFAARIEALKEKLKD